MGEPEVKFYLDNWTDECLPDECAGHSLDAFPEAGQ